MNNTSRYETLGGELNSKLGKVGGEFLAQQLHARLEQDLRNWFYDRVFHLFRGIPASEWPEHEQATCELLCRNEVSCFQAVESALVAREFGYVPEDCAEWFADWSLRLNLGDAAATKAKLSSFGLYWHSDSNRRCTILSTSVAHCLPNADESLPFISLYSPTIVLATKATIATVFNDHAVANASQAEFFKLDQSIQGTVQSFISGGGSCFAIEGERGLFITRDRSLGSLFHIWQSEGLAQQVCNECGTGHVVSQLTFRQLLSQLDEMKGCGIRYVTIDRPSRHANTNPVDIEELIGRLNRTIAEIDTSETGRLLLGLDPI
jgi:hypothetical protein